MKSIATKMSRVAGVIGHRRVTRGDVRRIVGAALVAEGVAVSLCFDTIACPERWALRVSATFIDSESGEMLTSEGAGSHEVIAEAFDVAEINAFLSAFGMALGDVAEPEAEPAPKVLRLATPTKVSTAVSPTPSPRKKAPLALWDELAAVRDTKSMRAWFVRYVPTVINWSPENRSIAWARIVAHCAPLGMSESELVAIRTEVIEHQEGA